MKEEKQSITIEGKTYTYLKDRLMGGYIYINVDRSTYLRSNTATEITNEITITKDLSERGFPVPHVLANGMLPNGESYYIEESIGEKVFGDIFMEETKTMGQVSDASFDAFICIIKRYCEAQFNSTNFVPHNKEALAQMISFTRVMRNNPPSEEMTSPFIEAFEKASDRVSSLPWGYIQADLNAFNILPHGIIDFELARFGPIGYDVLTNLYFGKMWPKKAVAYRFSDQQVKRYITEIDDIARAHHLPHISDYRDDFLVFKTIWGTGKDKKSEEDPTLYPDFWKWRTQVRDWCIRQYLKGEKIDTDQFEAVGKAD